MAKDKPIRRAAEAHSDLNVFAMVATLLEGGFIYGGSRTMRAAERIIQICQREQQNLLEEYDKACADNERGES